MGRVGHGPTDTTSQESARPPVVQDPALVELGINVIRGLAMDAPETANSGHSGTAMALAPLAHVLWTRIMRHDPPTRTGPTATGSSSPPATPRSCSIRCSTSPATTSPWTTSRQFRQWGSPHPRPPRARPHRRGRGHDRAAGPGLRQRRRHGHRRALPAGQVRPRGLRPPHVRDRRRRLLHGGHLARGRLAGGPPRPRPAHRRSTTTTTSPSTARPSWPTTTTSPSASTPTAGTCATWARWPTTPTVLEAAIRAAMDPVGGTGRRPHPAWCCAATSAGHRPS